MQSFRTELELVNHAGKVWVEKDIIELDKKINEFKDGKINEEKFRSLRLARGVYGQRQQGVQMVRIKIPFGRLTIPQLLKIADISDEYSNGNLHLTTRQDIQIHHVSLDRTPELWARLEQDDITLREACGNTVRNITASAIAGIDSKEPFDVSPYAFALFKYLLRKPFGQELGRKLKFAFSSSDDDSAYTFIHDLGFIPKMKFLNGETIRGFKVLVGGGLGAQPFLAKVIYEFLEEDQLIPFTEALIRVFDRHGERTSRHKARIKYLVNKIGVEQLLELIEGEKLALTEKTVRIDRDSVPVLFNKNPLNSYTTFRVSTNQKYADWLKSNVFEQKQSGFYGVNIKVRLGNITSDDARKLARIIESYASDEFRITINQGLLLKFIPKNALPAIFTALDSIGFAEPGFDSVADITSCPGTTTCNLAISGSTVISTELEKVIAAEFPDLLFNHDIKIKISGCMNSCGQHSLAQIGFHGSSFKNGNAVVPALQLLLGGGVEGNGNGRIADKIIKIPSKRGPAVLRSILNDYEKNAKTETFNAYYDARGKDYFYQLLKPFADSSSLVAEDYIDWGHTEKFKTEIGVGECAGVMIDLVATLIFEADEKIDLAQNTFSSDQYADSIYHSYSAIISASKAFLLERNIPSNTHHGIINDFNKHFVETGELSMEGSFNDFVLQINKNEPSSEFAEKYLRDAQGFIEKIKNLRAGKADELKIEKAGKV